MKKKKFLWWFSNSWNEKKKKQKLELATAHLVVESRYTMLYHDRHCLGAPGGATWPRGRVGVRSGTPRYGQPGHDTTSWVATQPTRAQGRVARARGPSCWGSVSRYNKLYRDRKAAWPLGCIVTQVRHDRGKRHDTTQGAAIRHNRACTMTWLGQACDTA